MLPESLSRDAKDVGIDCTGVGGAEDCEKVWKIGEAIDAPVCAEVGLGCGR
jgi:hypothetical protein